jgi:hypothetical protein
VGGGGGGGGRCYPATLCGWGSGQDALGRLCGRRLHAPSWAPGGCAARPPAGRLCTRPDPRPPPPCRAAQVCDDSTRESVRKKVDSAVIGCLEQGHNVMLVRRDNRSGYKAGAMVDGMARVEDQVGPGAGPGGAWGGGPGGAWGGAW